VRKVFSASCRHDLTGAARLHLSCQKPVIDKIRMILHCTA